MNTTNLKTISAGTLIGDKVVNPEGEDLGKVEELMIDATTGKVSYVVVSFGGFLGVGNKLFALPWSKLLIDDKDHRVIIDMPKQRLENAPGFDKDNWPDFSSMNHRNTIDSFYARN